MPVVTAHYEIVIQAPIQEVWNVMVDIHAYREWNPFVVGIDCADEPARVGSDLTLHVMFGNGKRLKTLERISALQAPSAGRALLEYQFLGPVADLGMVRGGRQQMLEALDANTTRYISHEDLTGWLSWLAPIKQVQDGFERHAKALKTRCEQMIATNGES